jgi:hypothetical protein
LICFYLILGEMNALEFQEGTEEDVEEGLTLQVRAIVLAVLAAVAAVEAEAETTIKRSIESAVIHHQVETRKERDLARKTRRKNINHLRESIQFLVLHQRVLQVQVELNKKVPLFIKNKN